MEGGGRREGAEVLQGGRGWVRGRGVVSGRMMGRGLIRREEGGDGVHDLLGPILDILEHFIVSVLELLEVVADPVVQLHHVGIGQGVLLLVSLHWVVVDVLLGLTSSFLLPPGQWNFFFFSFFLLQFGPKGPQKPPVFSGGGGD